MSTRHTTHQPTRTSHVSIGRARRRFARQREAVTTVSPALAGSPPLRDVRRRERTYRLALLAGDLAAAALVVGLALAWLPTRELSWTALLLPIVVPLVHVANGLYGRDAQVLNKSTLDEVSIIFRAATITTVVTYLLQSLVLTEPIGAKVVGLTWIGLTICVSACRVL